MAKKTNIMYLCGGLGLCSLLLIVVSIVIYLLLKNQEESFDSCHGDHKKSSYEDIEEPFYNNYIDCKHKKGKKNWVRAPNSYQSKYGCDKIRHVNGGNYKNNGTSWRKKGKNYECCVKLD